MSAAVAPTPTREQKIDPNERAALFSRLERYRRMSRKGEGARRASDTRGAKLYGGKHFESGPMPNQLAITSNQAVALYERLAATVTKNKPFPLIEPKNEANEDGAGLLEGAVATLWETDAMSFKTKISRRLVGFTRPALWYVSWDATRRAGIGEITTRIIPGYRSIIDDRFNHVREMEFCGFTEVATRAKLIQLFPDKADEIEAAMAGTMNAPPGLPANPLRDARGAPAGGDLDRLVASQPGGPYTGLTSVKVGGRFKGDPLAEEVEVEYLWIDDPTPTKETHPKKSQAGHPVMEVVRNEDDEIQFDVHGYEPVTTPFGPILQPNLAPRTRPKMETIVCKKYKYRRHIAYIPQDKVVLWDVAWNGPIPLTTDRDSFALDGYWSEGKALRLCSLSVARNIFLSIVFQRLKLSLSGTWLANANSGLSRNKLLPDVGVVYKVNNIDGIKQFPTDPIDSAYFQILNVIENEMQQLLGVSDVMQGQAAGRADSPDTYDKLIEQSGTAVIDDAQLLEQTIKEWTEIVLWFMQNYYTFEHVVECETLDGGSTWRAASALATRGEYAVNVETGSMISMSESAQFQRAMQYSGIGIYPLPMVAKLGHVPHWRRALRMKMAIAANPQLAAVLMGPSGASPGQQGVSARAAGKRSHHKPGGA